MNNTEKWILDWFHENNNEEILEDAENLINENYFEIGLIDSLGILTLIEEIESGFNINLNYKHFEQRRFSTISGLAEIIEEERSKNGSL